MATTTTNFGLKKYEGTDLFNPLTYENPNSDDIDAAMFYNKQHNCVDATELTTGTVHAITKTDTDAPLFSFTATSVYHAGDTFTLNGVAVTALLTSGETLPEGAYVIGSRVLGYVSGGGSLITFYVMKTTDLTPINNIIGNTDISGIGDGTLTGAIDALNDEMNHGSVSVTADGIMSYNSIFNALFALVNVSKLSANSKLEDAKSGNVNIYMVTQYTSTQIRASKVQADAGFVCEEAILNASTSTYYHAEGSSTQDWGTAKPSSGHVFTLYY